MQGHEVRSLIRFFLGGAHGDEGDFRLRRVGKIGVVALDFHTESVRGGCDLSAYRAEPKHAERFAEDFVTDKPFLALFHLFRHIVAREGRRPFRALDEVA